MITELSQQWKKWISHAISEMTIEQKIAQVMCWRVTNESIEEIKEIVRKCPVGAIFLGPAVFTAERSRLVAEAVKDISDIPIILNADLVNGAGARMIGGIQFPWQMACGAANSEDLVEKMGYATAKEARANGVHWTLAPVVDLDKNHRNPMMNIRTFGSGMDHVIRMSKAFIKGAQKDNMLIATAKHFPGDGIDDRDSHICTSVNSLSREEWFESYGVVWKEMIDSGVKAVMIGHIALPFMDPGDGSHVGPPPATFSSKIQLDLLRGKLGFDGVIVSDAIPMAGFCSHAPANDRCARNIRTGSDMVLWAEPGRDSKWMLDAVYDGRLTEERLDDAISRILKMKIELGLMGQHKTYAVTEQERKEFENWAENIAENSISIIRNSSSLLPLSLPENAKILTVTCDFGEPLRGIIQNLDVVDDELRKRGFIVDHLHNPAGKELSEICNKYDAVFINLHVLPRYGTIQMFGKLADVFWDSFWLEHDRVVFTSFGDPYKIYELPSIPNMVNCFSNTPASQRAAVKVWLGELAAKGKNPVSLRGFFRSEV